MSVLFIEIFALSWEVVLRFFSTFLIDSMGNSYCRKNYSKGTVNAVKITQIRLKKMKKYVAMVSFHCLVCKI